MCKPLIIVGAGGHGKVILDLALRAGFSVEGYLEDNPMLRDVLDFSCIDNVSEIAKYADRYQFVCAIGDNANRKKIDISKTVDWATIVHPTVCIGLDVVIGSGTVVMAGAVINPSARIGRHCIINTCAVVEHDCLVSDYTHISPNALLCGEVQIGESAWIGAGATIKNGISICNGVVVGAGAVVVKDITEEGVYCGVPARRVK